MIEIKTCNFDRPQPRCRQHSQGGEIYFFYPPQCRPSYLLYAIAICTFISIHYRNKLCKNPPYILFFKSRKRSQCFCRRQNNKDCCLYKYILLTLDSEFLKLKDLSA